MKDSTDNSAQSKEMTNICLWILDFCAYRWRWYLAFLFLWATGASGSTRAYLTAPHLLAHHWQPVRYSGTAILLVNQSWRGLLVLCETVCLYTTFLSRAAASRYGPGFFRCWVEFRNTVAPLCSLTASRWAVTSIQPAFGPSFCGRGVARRALRTWT